MYRDSVEIDELKHPMEFRFLRMLPGTAGAGRFRGAPAMELAYGPTRSPMDVLWPCDGTHYAPKGVRGGQDGTCARHFHVRTDGSEEELPNIVNVQLQPGEYVRGNHAAGGGYGNPLERDPRRVLKDVLEGYETEARARDVYGVVFAGSVEDATLTLDSPATAALRAGLAA